MLYFDRIEQGLTFRNKLDTLDVIIDQGIREKDKKGLSNCYRRLGIIYQDHGKSDSAINYLTKATELARSANYSLSEASGLNEIACIYSQLGNTQQATIYFEKAFDVYKAIPDRRGMSDASLNLSELSLEQGRTSDALKSCLQSMQYRHEWGDTSDIGYNYDLLSRIHLELGDPANALRYAGIAMQQFKLNGDDYGLLSGLAQTGKCYRDRNKPDSALRYFKECFRLAKHYQYKSWIEQAAYLLSQVYKDKGSTDSAFSYLGIYAAYKDSLLNEAITRATMDAAVRYDTREKEIELRAQQKLAQNSTLLNYALVAMVFLLLITILVLIRNSSQRRKIHEKQSDLDQANAMLKGQDEERERIARELHDRVGSMISAVKLHFSAMEEHTNDLLAQQKKTYERALGLLDETYEEVRRISHDLDTGLLGRFGLNTAMTQLAQLIQSTNKLRVRYIDTNLDPALYKNYETDLYRITQELLSNTIKYASAEEVSIQLSRSNGNLVYSYEDDGRGFSKEALKEARGIGYKNIDARVKKMKGRWHLDTSPGNGLILIIEVPLLEHKDHYS